MNVLLMRTMYIPRITWRTEKTRVVISEALVLMTVIRVRGGGGGGAGERQGRGRVGNK